MPNSLSTCGCHPSGPGDLLGFSFINLFLMISYVSVRVMSKVPTTPACAWWNRPEEDNSSGKLESTHPSRTSVKSDQVFFWCRVSHASTLTHYSSELLLPRHQGL